MPGIRNSWARRLARWVGRMAADCAIEAQGLVKSYGDVRALDGVDLTAPEGTVLGLLGPNGAGKTPAVRILTTLLPADGGSARVAGLDVATEAPQLRSKIGLAGQYAAVDENLSGFENLQMVGRLYHLPKGEPKARATELLERFDLAEAGSRLVRTYSGGVRRWVALRARGGWRGRGSSSSTSRRPGSTRAAGRGCGRRSKAGSPTGPRSFSPPSTST